MFSVFSCACRLSLVSVWFLLGLHPDSVVGQAQTRREGQVQVREIQEKTGIGLDQEVYRQKKEETSE